MSDGILYAAHSGRYPALGELRRPWWRGSLEGLRLDPEVKRGLTREARGELAGLLRSIAG